MKRLFLLASFLVVFCAINSIAQIITSATDMIDRGGGSYPLIWNKFIGNITDVDVPDLIDFSYSGYKNSQGEISIINY